MDVMEPEIPVEPQGGEGFPPGNAASTGSKSQIDIEVESPKARRSLIVSLAWPSLAESFLTSLVQLVDMIMVGSLGAQAIGAVGLVTQPKFVMLASFMALNIGATAMVSRFKGARDRENANLAFHQSVLMTIGITLVLCLGMFFWGDNLLRFLAGRSISGDMISGANTYLRIQVYGFPAVSLTFAINATLRGVGNTRAAFYNNLVSNLVNIFFNYCLIGGNFGFPALGVAGASIATVIGQCGALSMALSRVLRGKEFVHLQFRKLLIIDFSMIRRILRIGIPAMVEQVILRTGAMIYTKIITSLGDRSFAAHMIAVSIQTFSFMTGMAFGTAATTLVGQCLGRLRPDLAKLYVKMTQNLSYIVSFFIALTVFFGGEFIASFFTTDRELSHLVANMLKIIAVVIPFSNARFVYLSALRGAGDSFYSAVVTFFGVLLVRPVISLLLVIPHLPFQLGLAGVWIALSSDGLVCYLLARRRFLQGKWVDIKV